ncbi:hypothetical protein SAMN05444397_107118 [Flavobacterium aquidurense]|nr:hypothetical protein SAMN05444397_107118 [Flavobacterium aquidurense]
MFFLMLINVYDVYSSNPPANMPLPKSSNGVQTNADSPDLPPGAPIDQGLFILTGFAVLFGIYAIRKYDFIKKASV